MTTAADKRRIMRAVRLAELAAASGPRGAARRSRPVQQTEVRPVKNLSGSLIPAYSFVQQTGELNPDGLIFHDYIPVTKPNYAYGYAGTAIGVTQRAIGTGGFGEAIFGGRAWVAFDATEWAAMGSSQALRSVGPRDGQWTATAAGPFRVVWPTNRNRLWAGSASAPYLIEIELWQGRYSDRLRIAATITTAGPSGEADWTDARYWVIPNGTSDGTDAGQIMTAVNLVEYYAENPSNKTHLIPPKTVVEITPWGQGTSFIPWAFSIRPANLIIVEITSSSGSAWNSQTLAGKPYDPYYVVTYGPALTVTVPSVPAAVESSYPVLGVGAKCICTINPTSPTFVFVGSYAIPTPSVFYTAGAGGGNKIAAYST